MTEHKHKFSVDASCECGVMISELINQQEAKLEAAEKELLDARSYVAEVALGGTHYPHDEGQPCVRCDRDALESSLKAAKEALYTICRINSTDSITEGKADLMFLVADKALSGQPLPCSCQIVKGGCVNEDCTCSCVIHKPLPEDRYRKGVQDALVLLENVRVRDAEAANFLMKAGELLNQAIAPGEIKK